MAREKKKTVLMCIHGMKGIHHVIDPSLMVNGSSKISDFFIGCVYCVEAPSYVSIGKIDKSICSMVNEIGSNANVRCDDKIILSC